MRMLLGAVRGSIPGFLVAFAVPVSGLFVALLWDRQVIDLHSMRTGPALIVFWGELVFGPIGLVIAARAGVRTYLGRLFLVFPMLPALVPLVYLEVAAVFALSGLGGAPF